MTPSKQGKTTLIKIERRKHQGTGEGVVHVGGGQNSGLVVAKDSCGKC